MQENIRFTNNTKLFELVSKCLDRIIGINFSDEIDVIIKEFIFIMKKNIENNKNIEYYNEFLNKKEKDENFLTLGINSYNRSKQQYKLDTDNINFLINKANQFHETTKIYNLFDESEKLYVDIPNTRKPRYVKIDSSITELPYWIINMGPYFGNNRMLCNTIKPYQIINEIPLEKIELYNSIEKIESILEKLSKIASGKLINFDNNFIRFIVMMKLREINRKIEELHFSVSICFPLCDYEQHKFIPANLQDDITADKFKSVMCDGRLNCITGNLHSYHYYEHGLSSCTIHTNNNEDYCFICFQNKQNMEDYQNYIFSITELTSAYNNNGNGCFNFNDLINLMENFCSMII